MSGAFAGALSYEMRFASSSSIIDKLNGMQAGPIQASEKSTRKRLEKSGFDINVAGMKMNTKMIAGLSSNAMKSTMLIASSIGMHYIALKDDI